MESSILQLKWLLISFPKGKTCLYKKRSYGFELNTPFAQMPRNLPALNSEQPGRKL